MRGHVNRADSDLKLPNNFVTSSFHELQDLLLLNYENGIIDDNEFSVLHEEFMPKNSNFSYGEYDRFSLKEMNVMNDAEFPA